MIPAPAATLLVLRDDPLQVLMLRRNERGSFPGAVVFPGGMVEPSDADESWDALVTGGADLTRQQRAVRIAGLRETWEEAGILVTQNGSAPADRRLEFGTAVREAGGRLDLDGLHYFARWITPELAPRRYDTRFYLVREPAGQTAVADGEEALGVEWLAPSEALAREASGQQALLLPTRLNLQRLAESNSVADAIAAATARARFPVRPQVRLDSRTVVVPEEAGYGRTEEQLPESEPQSP